MTLATSTDTAPSPSRFGRRVAGAAATGLAIVALWGLLTAIAVAVTPCRAEGFGCLGVALVLSAVAAAAAGVAAWPMLHLLRVRPAWPVALLGPIALGGLGG